MPFSLSYSLGLFGGPFIKRCLGLLELRKVQARQSHLTVRARAVGGIRVCLATVTQVTHE